MAEEESFTCSFFDSVEVVNQLFELEFVFLSFRKIVLVKTLKFLLPRYCEVVIYTIKIAMSLRPPNLAGCYINRENISLPRLLGREFLHVFASNTNCCGHQTWQVLRFLWEVTGKILADTG